MADDQEGSVDMWSLAVEWTFVGLSGLFVAARLYFRWFMLRRRNSPSDIVILLAWLISVASMGLYTRVAWLGFWDQDIRPTDFTPGDPHSVWKRKDPERIREFFIITWASFIPFCLTLWGVKLSLLLLFYSLVPRILPGMRLALNLISIFVAVTFVLNLCLNLFYCHPLPLNWTTDEEKFCLSQEQKVPYFVGLGTHLASDLALYFFPFSLFRMLNIDRRQRLGVFFIFALGTLCLACIIVRAVRSQHGATALITIDFWFSLEQSLSIIVVCCPALKTLLSRRRLRRIVGGTEGSVVEPNSHSKVKNWKAAKGNRTSRTVSLTIGTITGTFFSNDAARNSHDNGEDDIHELSPSSRSRSGDEESADLELEGDRDESVDNILFGEAEVIPKDGETKKLKVLNGKCVPTKEG